MKRRGAARAWIRCRTKTAAHTAKTVFAPDLAENSLITNKSVWRQFPFGGMPPLVGGSSILIGDALRTVHFSIGSGTRHGF
jgi:hypothetical protein